jgi:hypothetical protein
MTASPAWAEKAFAATAGRQLGAILHCALGVEQSGAHFVGKASVTSDGFVMCDFVDANGQYRMGAFVGSLSDLSRNTFGLAEHLDLTPPEAAELRATLLGAWIGKDWRH